MKTIIRLVLFLALFFSGFSAKAQWFGQEHLNVTSPSTVVQGELLSIRWEHASFYVPEETYMNLLCFNSDTMELSSIVTDMKSGGTGSGDWPWLANVSPGKYEIQIWEDDWVSLFASGEIFVTVVPPPPPPAVEMISPVIQAGSFPNIQFPVKGIRSAEDVQLFLVQNGSPPETAREIKTMGGSYEEETAGLRVQWQFTLVDSGTTAYSIRKDDDAPHWSIASSGEYRLLVGVLKDRRNRQYPPAKWDPSAFSSLSPTHSFLIGGEPLLWSVYENIAGGQYDKILAIVGLPDHIYTAVWSGGLLPWSKAEKIWTDSRGRAVFFFSQSVVATGPTTKITLRE